METQTGAYRSITNNITIYRPINATDLTMRCQCVNEGNVTPYWSLPVGHMLDKSISSSECRHVGICIMNQSLSFSLLRRAQDGYYKCYTTSVSVGFNLLVFGKALK